MPRGQYDRKLAAKRRAMAAARDAKATKRSKGDGVGRKAATKRPKVASRKKRQYAPGTPNFDRGTIGVLIEMARRSSDSTASIAQSFASISDSLSRLANHFAPRKVTVSTSIGAAVVVQPDAAVRLSNGRSGFCDPPVCFDDDPADSDADSAAKQDKEQESATPDSTFHAAGESAVAREAYVPGYFDDPPPQEADIMRLARQEIGA